MLLDQLQTDLTSAVKNRDQVRVDTLRFLLGAVFNAQIEKYPPNSGGSMTDADVLSVIAKQVKTHRESIVMFEQGKREDLVKVEKAQLTILESYLPKQMGEEEVRLKIKKVKEENPSADFGTLMKLCMAELKGQVDGSLVSKIVKENV